MAARKSGLGKGLDSLITDKVSQKQSDDHISDEKKNQTIVKISQVEPNRSQPRKNFDEDALSELADSIREYGILQPLLVQKRDDYYEIIAGERRWRAAKIAGLKEVPVIIKELTDQEIVEISLIENIQREDLNPIEEAMAYQRLLTEFHLKQEDLANRVSKSRSAITNSMRLLKLSDAVQQMIIREELTIGHARPLIGIEDEEEQCRIAKKIVDEKLNVRQTEKLIKNKEKRKKSEENQEKEDRLSCIYDDIQEQLKEILGTRVKVVPKKNRTGKIEIEYYSQDELERLLDLIKSIERE